MSMRRPRIKASANLMSSKRKAKSQVDKLTENDDERKTSNEIDKLSEDSTKGSGALDVVQQPIDNDINNAPIDTIAATTSVNGHMADGNKSEVNGTIEKRINTHDTDVEQSNDSINNLDKSVENTLETAKDLVDYSPIPNGSNIDQFESLNRTKSNLKDEDTHIDIETNAPKTEKNPSFKCPPNVTFNRSNSSNAPVSVSGSDEVFHSDIEDNVIQMDLQKSINMQPMSPMSPSKAVSRQRIRATPIFGQRRNSFVGSSPSPHTGGDEFGGELSAPSHRRERHISASLSQTSNSSSSHLHHHFTPHKYVPSMGRIRTESGCSAFSDSYAPSSKSRKTDDQHHRALSRRDFEARFNNGVVPDKSMLKMFDLIYYNPETNPMEQKPNISAIKHETNPDDPKAQSEDIKPDADNLADSKAMPVPQLKLNSNGELILDDKSLEIETTAEQEARKVLANSSLIFLDENTGMNGFYKKQKRTKEWPPEETIKFYRCLQTVGTDFSLMGQLFPNRTRRDLKLKFKKEERCNLALINKALLYPKIFNIDELKVQLETEEHEREEAERRWKEIKAQEAKSLKKVQVTSSAGARVLVLGDEIYQNENVTKRKFSNRPKKVHASAKINNGFSEANTVEQPKKKRIRMQNNQNNPENGPSNISDNEIKCETIKIENGHVDNQTRIVIDPNQLEQELSELLHSNQPLVGNNTNNYVPIIETPTGNIEHQIMENKSLVNMDDGTVTIINDEVIVPHNIPISPVEEVSEASNEDACDMEESDIQQILTELAEGSMVLVSTMDPNNPEKVLNEIYMLDKNTGELCDKPLDIPDAIVQCILTVMS